MCYERDIVDFKSNAGVWVMVGVRYVSLCYTITKEELMVVGVSRHHLKGDGEKLAGSAVSFVGSSATGCFLFLCFCLLII